MRQHLAAAIITIAVFFSEPAGGYITKTEELLNFYNDDSGTGQPVAEMYVLSYADGFIDAMKIFEVSDVFCVPEIERPALAVAILHWINHPDQQQLRDGNHSAGFSVLSAMNALFLCNEPLN